MNRRIRRTLHDRYIVAFEEQTRPNEDFWRRSLQPQSSGPFRSDTITPTNVGNENDNSNSPRRAAVKLSSFGIDYDQVLRETLNLQQTRFQATPLSIHADIRSYEASLPSLMDRYILKRHDEIEQSPASVLDAPGLRDDFYLNILDWSPNDLLAVALDATVYLWEASTSSVRAVCQVDEQFNYISAVSFTSDGSKIICGNSQGCLSMTDVGSEALVRNYHIKDVGRVASIAVATSDPTFTVGTRSGKLFHLDPRDHSRPAAILSGHRLEVCGLKRSPEETLLASGGNDNLVLIWDLRWPGGPQWTQDCHEAAVKALAWCPWKSRLLATGGGTADRRIRFWNTQTNICSREIQTDSQICGLHWSKSAHEIVSTHGFSSNELALWHYPSTKKILGIRAHESRVLHAVMSGDGETMVTAAANEHLKFWKIFPPANS